MRVLNETAGTVLADRATVAATFFRRFVGLMGRRGLMPGEGLILVPCGAVHTLFMRFPIDVLFLDRSQRVVAASSDLRPYSCPPAARAARYTVELPAGTVVASGTKVGDQIRLVAREERETAEPGAPTGARRRGRGF